MNGRRQFVLLGGFLGAGKTTAIARLARHFEAQDLRVAIVTNDQTTDLVDTQLLRSQGFAVDEVAGSCFCCNFPALTKSVERLSASQRPDVILAEPVGSCTDLVATVIRPLERLYAEPFDIAPYGVIVKPSHGLRILKGHAPGDFAASAEYIFRKQLEEADFVIINRIGELPPAEVDELAALVEREFPGRPVVRISAKTGAGFDSLTEFLARRGGFGQRPIEVDYDLYAIGEAELGWLNSQVSLSSATVFDLDRFVFGLVQRLQNVLAKIPAETAHLKVIGQDGSAYAVANVVSSFTEPMLSVAANRRTNAATAVVNARVALAPESLAALVRRAVVAEAGVHGASARIETLQSFRPGRPVPTHRLLTV